MKELLHEDDIREEGRAEGREEGLIQLICKKYAKGLTAEAVAEMLEVDEDFVRAIYHLADRHAPDIDYRTIYEEYAK